MSFFAILCALLIEQVRPLGPHNPVYGTVLAWTNDEIVIRHQDPSVGEVNLHFPRVGFDLAPAEKAAA